MKGNNTKLSSIEIFDCFYFDGLSIRCGKSNEYDFLDEYHNQLLKPTFKNDYDIKIQSIIG